MDIEHVIGQYTGEPATWVLRVTQNADERGVRRADG